MKIGKIKDKYDTWNEGDTPRIDRQDIYPDIKLGAHVNNAVTTRGGGLKGSNADQQALHNGYNYKGPVWKRK